MEPGRWQEIEQLYHAASRLEGSERAAFLERSCFSDPALRQEVESLLTVASDADGYLKAAVEGAAASMPDAGATLLRHGDGPTPPTLGRYQLLEQVGRGGMGVVYRAVDPAIGRVVAIKTIRFDEASEGKNAELRARLLRESQAGGRLTHPNIVGVYDVCEEGQTAYIVMEFVEGRTLEEAAGGASALRPADEVLKIIEECAAALDYAHSRGIIHRDIKPANIMLQAGGGGVKIADFGIAKAAQLSPLTQSAVVVGSPSYMAPEQWKGGAVSGQTDQYALAAVAYGLLTGHGLFEGETMASLVTKALYEEASAPSTQNALLNSAVDEVFRKALAKIAANRYDSCGQFAAALRVALQGQSATALQPPLQRRRNLLAAFAIVGVLAAAGSGLWLYEKSSATQVEIAYWSSVKDSKTRSPFEAYLKRYPEGQFAGLAKAQLEALTVNPEPPQKEPKTPAKADLSKTSAVPRDPVRPTKDPPGKPIVDGDPYAQGNTRLKSGNYAEAVPYFSKAIAVKPEYRAYFGRAGAYQNLGQMNEAIADYTEAIRLNQSSAMAYHDRAVCLARLKENDRALADYDRALQLASGNPLTWNGRGVIYLRRKEYGKAILDFSEAIRLRPTLAQAYQNRAAAKKALGDAAGANEDLNQARALGQQ